MLRRSIAPPTLDGNHDTRSLLRSPASTGVDRAIIGRGGCKPRVNGKKEYPVHNLPGTFWMTHKNHPFRRGLTFNARFRAILLRDRHSPSAEKLTFNYPSLLSPSSVNQQRTQLLTPLTPCCVWFLLRKLPFTSCRLDNRLLAHQTLFRRRTRKFAINVRADVLLLSYRNSSEPGVLRVTVRKRTCGVFLTAFPLSSRSFVSLV